MRAAHNWLGLILALQVFLWMLSGAVMSLYDIDLVRGRTNAMSEFPPELDMRGYASIGGVIAQTPGATGVELKFMMNKPVYIVTGVRGAALYDAGTAEKLSPLKEEMARMIAERDFIGDGKIVSAKLVDEKPLECSACEPPVWRIQFSDRLDTRIFISPATAKIVARRNSVWRLYDFFWMLHIMDYKEREDFNNWPLRIFAVTGTLFAITGLYLVVLRLLRGKYWVSNRRR